MSTRKGFPEERDEYIQRCFRHQHPEAYGRPPVLTARNMPYPVASREEDVPPSYSVPLEPTGDPEAVQLPEEWSVRLRDELEADLEVRSVEGTTADTTTDNL